MKIERINENQIRCTLTSEDLADRQLRISELVSGSEKAKSLFRDMMQMAHSEFGFEADNIPLMIEAMPSASGLVLIITKVDDPDDLDNKLAKFGQLPFGGTADSDNVHIERADDILDIFKKIYEAKVKSKQPKQEETKKPEGKPVDETASVDLIRLYEFGTLDGVIEAAFSLNNYYKGVNSLYKDSRHGIYMLVVHQSSHTPEEFNRICNILSEYASGQPYSNASEAYLQEHKDIVIAETAIQRLSQLK